VVDGKQQQRKYDRGDRTQYPPSRGAGKRDILDVQQTIVQCSAQCQAEKRGLATDIFLLYEFESKTMNERFL